MTELTRRRSRRSEENEEERERPTRRRRSSTEDKGEAEPEGKETPRRSRRNRGEDAGSKRRRSGTGGFDSYQQKKRSTSSFADDFKPGENNPTLIKFLDAEPFDVYNQHWLDDMPKGERKSYVCRDDEYFEGDKGEKGCPLCDIGEPAKTFSLFNVLDLTNPRKPEVKVWSTSPAVTDLLARASTDKKTSPLDREDLYFEVELVKKGRKYNWVVTPVKARDLEEDYDMEPLDADELAAFEDDMFTDRTAVTKVDSYDDLDELAESLDD